MHKASKEKQTLIRESLTRPASIAATVKTVSLYLPNQTSSSNVRAVTCSARQRSLSLRARLATLQTKTGTYVENLILKRPFVAFSFQLEASEMPYTLIITACLGVNLSCKEHQTEYGFTALMECSILSQRATAEWQTLHPKWTVRRFRCHPQNPLANL